MRNTVRIGEMKLKPMPNPTSYELDCPLFNAIWDTIKSWDINVPEYYEGYCEANGSHVKLIIDAVQLVIAKAIKEAAAEYSISTGKITHEESIMDVEY